MQAVGAWRPTHVARIAFAALLATACTVGQEPAPVPPPPDAAPDVEEPPSPPVDPAPRVPPPPQPGPGIGAFGVSAGDPAAVEAGMSLLAAGGNAVDAAVATAFAVAAVEPFASGIGGGGAALVVPTEQAPIAYDYREVVAADGVIPASNTGVPGFVAGMAALHEEHGAVTFSEVLAPAIALARDGAATSEIVAAQLAGAAHRLPVARLGHLFPGGSPLTAGQPLVQPDLADTMQLLADEGPDAFYLGVLAGRLAAFDGLDAGSLAAYEVQRSAAPSGAFAGHEVVVAAPPLPGVGLIQMLQLAEAMGVGRHPPGSADGIHLLAMAWRMADRSVSWELGDPAFVDVPVAELTDPAANQALAASIPLDSVPAVDTSRPARDPSGNTTHLTVVDADGMVVSMTNTLTNFWGSGQYVDGFFLNDQLSRFSIGRSEANEPAAGRRSVSWSLPAVVLDEDGRPVLALGSPGGRRIPLVLGQVLVRWAMHDQALQEAVDANRFHLEGAELEFEVPPEGAIADELRSLGYEGLSVPSSPYYFGSVQAFEIDHQAGALRGARDTRRNADWAVGAP